MSNIRSLAASKDGPSVTWVKIIADDQLIAGELLEQTFNVLTTCDASSKKYTRMIRLNKSGILKMQRKESEEKPRLEIVPLGAPGTDGASFINSDKIVTITPIVNGRIIEDLDKFYSEPAPVTPTRVAGMAYGTNVGGMRTQ